ncbi:MAG: class I SAM-dependent methyltransferase [Acidobacteria bacterium]|nr:class I SAM-dependent methyltransferase [Acidobacteriota bacterium]
MTDADDYIRALVAFTPLIEPVYRAAIRKLGLPAGSHGLDVGCGIGLQTLLFAQALGPESRVTGLDISPEFLGRAREIVEEAGLSERISFREGNAGDLPFGDDSFDWAWSSCCVGYYSAIDPLPAVRELARVVRPGGVVAILVWSSERLLPGYPMLEARLGATTPGIAPFTEGKDPGLHSMRALGLFREGGLLNASARTFAGGAHAPLRDDHREALASLLGMRWPDVEPELSPEDRSVYRRLCLRESPEFILNHPDYCAFFTCTMFNGTVAG